MIFYAPGFRGLFRLNGSSLSGVRHLILLFTLYSMAVVKFIETCEQGHSTISLPSLSGIATIAGVMLAMQGSSAFSRFQKGLSYALSIETASIELFRYACMLFDTPETAWMRAYMRRALLASILSIIVELRVNASGGGSIPEALGLQVFRDAIGDGLLLQKELDAGIEAENSRVQGRIARAIASETQQKISQSLLFGEAYASWRER